MFKNPVLSGCILFAITLSLFFAVYFLYGGMHFFDMSMKVNAFVLPLIYVLFAFLCVRALWKLKGRINFREAFRSSFLPMFIGGLLSMVAIFSFLNYVDAAAKDILNHQYVQRQRAELDAEYNKAKQILKNQADKDELEQKYRERLASFSETHVRGKDMLTFTHFSAYFGAVFLFYLIISLFLAAFFRSRSAR